jgi:hypothetical protein
VLLVFERKATKNRLFSWFSKAKMVEKSAFFDFRIAKTAQKSAFFETFFGRKRNGSFPPCEKDPIGCTTRGSQKTVDEISGG